MFKHAVKQDLQQMLNEETFKTVKRIILKKFIAGVAGIKRKIHFVTLLSRVIMDKRNIS